MQELETQVVKIQLGDNKQSSSFVYTFAETINSQDTELYVICELPMFNPAAADECQRISQAITSAIKRSYRGEVEAETFENALALINEELSKLVTIGKTHWLGKLNAIIGVKHNDILSVSSVGKISALLYRDGKFVSVTEPGNTNQPLKTFEHFSEGKLKLNDMFVLSTSQLFNHLSVDRIKKLVDKNELPIAAQEIIEILQDDMGPEIACGSIFALQTEPSPEITPDEVDLAEFLNQSPDQQSQSLSPQIKSQIKAGFIPHSVKNYAKTGGILAKSFFADIKDKYLKLSYWRNLANHSGQTIGMVQGKLKSTAKKIQPERINNYSRQKKFFMLAGVGLVLILVVNIAIAKLQNNSTQTVQFNTEQLTEIEKQLNDANASLIFGDETKARELFAQAQNLLNNLGQPESQENIDKVNELKTLAQDLDKKLNKVETATVKNLGTLASSDHLIALPDYIAVENNRTIVSYNRNNGSISDNELSTSESIIQAIALKNADRAAVYNGSELLIWNTETGSVTNGTKDQVPNQSDFGGMKTYAVNNKVYIIDQADAVIRSFATTNTGFTNPQTSVEDQALKNAIDLAIDGNIYFISGGEIYKYNSGDKQDFSPAVKNLSDQSKIYTELDYEYIYLLDPENNKIIVLNKEGGLVKNITSDQFTNLRDFVVDENNDKIYVLNGDQLLQIEL
ncbi:MAG: hypothetical protein R3B41_01965 [Candidatus Doudnabacteria bacterium]